MGRGLTCYSQIYPESSLQTRCPPITPPHATKCPSGDETRCLFNTLRLGPKMQMQMSASTTSSCSLLPRTKPVTKAALWESSFMASSGLTPSSSIPGCTFKHLQHSFAEPSYRYSYWRQLASDQVCSRLSLKAQSFPPPQRSVRLEMVQEFFRFTALQNQSSNAADDPILLIP